MGFGRRRVEGEGFAEVALRFGELRNTEVPRGFGDLDVGAGGYLLRERGTGRGEKGEAIQHGVLRYSLAAALMGWVGEHCRTDEGMGRPGRSLLF